MPTITLTGEVCGEVTISPTTVTFTYSGSDSVREAMDDLAEAVADKLEKAGCDEKADEYREAIS
jgi:hypothetical protein